MDFENVVLLESSWEVCRQIGGIYRVLRTKVPAMIETFKENYCLIGPDFKEISNLEFEEVPPQGIYSNVIKLYLEKGYRARFGKWLITGNPNVILIDYLSHFSKIQEYKYYFWKDHGIETFDEMWLNDSILFGYQLTELIKIFEQILWGEYQLILHLHEWNVGTVIPIIKKNNLKVKLVFTTHATLLARYIASHVENFYDYMRYMNPYEEARKYNILPHYLIERASAYGADVFTTVSEITKEETKYLLEKEADLITPNGLNIQKFVATHEQENLHGLYKKRIHQFISGYFFPYYVFDLDKTIYIFTSGRYEFRNKGFDIFIDSLSILNSLILSNNLDIHVVAFIITYASTKGYHYDVLRNQYQFDELIHICEKISQNIPERILEQIVLNPEIQMDKLITETELMYLKRIYHSWKKKGYPSVVTHEMNYPNDLILNQIYKNNLLNQPESKVKVVYHPDFLSSFGSIFKLDYLDFLKGCHLGVFPSYYEPWGYTPMECSASGIPSITSDYTGFSLYLKEQLPNHNDLGMYILQRKNKSYHQVVEELAHMIFKVVSMSRKERISLRIKVENQSSLFDWRNLIKNYLNAYKLALRK
ncbi:MAG: glycosyltransferase [Leptonema sp. (in: bacteria)]